MRRIVRKHIQAIGRDVSMLLYNIFLFLCVLILIVRFPKYISYLPTASSMDDLANFGKEMIQESFRSFWELFFLIFVFDTWTVTVRAVLFAFLMPAAGLAELMWTVCPGLGDSERFILGIGLWSGLFAAPIFIIYLVKSPILINLGVYSAVLLLILLFCFSASCLSAPEGRVVNLKRWSAPSVRLDRWPNLFAIFTVPMETILLGKG